MSGGYMKLIMAIIHDSDVSEVTANMLKEGFVVTKIGSSGGFLRSKMTTVMCAARTETVGTALEILKKSCHSRKFKPADMTAAASYAVPDYMGEQISVGGARVFVLNIEQDYKY